MSKKKPTPTTMPNTTCKEAEDESLANLEAWAIASDTTDPATWDDGYKSYMDREIVIKEARFGHGVGHPKPRPH